MDSQQTREQVKAKKFPVVEIFGPVIQGEGSQAGVQTMFVRFGGCDYRCQKCDSLHAVLPEAIQKYATYMTALEIANKLAEAQERTGVNWVTFSGGNPCMHKLEDLVGIITEDLQMQINVETQGTLWQDWLYNCTVVTVSPKSWGMGEKFEEAKYRRFVERLNGSRPLCVKVVVFSEQDLEFALSIYQITQEAAKNYLYDGAIAYYLSLGNFDPPQMDDEFNLHQHPEGGSHTEHILALLSSYRRLSEELLQDPRLKMYKFLPQIHVLAYGNETGR